MIQSVQNQNKFLVAAGLITNLKSLFNYTVEHCNSRKQFGLPLSNFDLVKSQIARMAERLYCLESMVYMTAGICDISEYPDIEVESAIVKVYAAETAAILGRWFGGAENSGCSQTVAPRIACLQEFPASPLLQDAVLRKVRLVAGRPGITIAVSPSGTSAGDADRWSPPSSCVAIAWDADARGLLHNAELLIPKRPAGAVGLLLQRLGAAAPVSVFSIHVPFIDSVGGALYKDALKSAHQALTDLRDCSASPCAGVIVVGDFNVDLRDAATIVGESPFELAIFDSSATFGGKATTVDACACAVVARQACAELHERTSIERAPASALERVWRVGASMPFFGQSRDDFLERSLVRSLQDDPRVWQLSDDALASLGLCPFMEQPQVLTRLLEQVSNTKGRPRKRARLTNPLAAAQVGSATVSSDSEDETSSSESVATA